MGSRTTRRTFVKMLIAGVTVSIARGQYLWHRMTWPSLVFQTTQTTAPAFTPAFTGVDVQWKWPDGTYTNVNDGLNPNKTFSAGTKRVWARCRVGFRGMITFSAESQSFVGSLPSFGRSNSLDTFDCSINGFTGVLPSFSTCTVLMVIAVNGNSFSGALPSFAGCTGVRILDFSVNNFSSTIPSFAACTAMTLLRLFTNSFTDVVAGSFATQKSLATFNAAGNALPASAINQILADFIVSLGISGRVHCTVTLNGGTNAAPTGQGIIDKAALIVAGWTVTTN